MLVIKNANEMDSKAFAAEVIDLFCKVCSDLNLKNNNMP